MSFDIAYIVSHGFAARMVTQTDLLGKLVRKGKSVALISPDSSDENLKKYCAENNVELFEFNEGGKIINQQYIYKRKYYLEELEENPALLEKHIYATKYNKSLNPFTHIWPRYYWIIYQLIKRMPLIRQQFKKKEKHYLASNEAKILLAQINPKKLISTYPVAFNEAALLHHANQNSQTETWIHLLSWDNITCKGHFPALAHKYIAWGPIMKEELKQYYNIKDEDIAVCGVPHFDVHSEVKEKPYFEKYVEKLGLNPRKKYLFFAMSSPRFAPKEIDIVEWLADKVEKNEFKDDLQLIVRPHPQNVQGGMADKSWLPRLKQINKLKNTAVDIPDLISSSLSWSMHQDDMLRLAHLITGSLITLNSGSTVCIDALLHNKPVILTSFDGNHDFPYWKSSARLLDYTHLRKLISFNGISVVNSYNSLQKEIKKYLLEGHYLLDEGVITLNQECSNLGVSTKKVVEELA